MIPCECEEVSCIYPEMGWWLSGEGNSFPAIKCCGDLWIASDECKDCHGAFPDSLIRQRSFINKMRQI